jgi:hypothetical protein
VQQQREGNLATRKKVSPAFRRALRSFLRRGRVYFLYGDQDFTYEEFRFAADRLRPLVSRAEVEVVPDLSIHTFATAELQALTCRKVVEWVVSAAGLSRSDTGLASKGGRSTMGRGRLANALDSSRIESTNG